MKRTVRFYASIIGVLMACSSGWLVPNPVGAQSTPTVVPQSSNQNDAETLALLLRALVNFGQSDGIEMTSELSMQVTSPGLSAEMNVQSQKIARKPNQFRADVIFVSSSNKVRSNAPSRRYQIISDGKFVWIYRPDTQQYSVQTYAEFDKSNENFLTGLLSSMFSQLPANLNASSLNQKLAQLTSNPALSSSFYKETGLQFKGYQQDESGKNFAVYFITDAKKPISVKQLELWIDPQTAAVKQLQLSGKEKNFDLAIQERVINFMTKPKVEPNTFRFIAPKGSKRLKTLSINPFES